MKCLQTPPKQWVATKLAPSALKKISHKRHFQPIPAKDRHPAEEDLEDFLFNRLPECQQQNIVSHLNLCDSCSEILIASAEVRSWLKKAMGIHELCESWPESWESPPRLRLLNPTVD